MAESVDDVLKRLGVAEDKRADVHVAIANQRKRSTEYLEEDIVEMQKKLDYEEQILGSKKSQLEIYELTNKITAAEGKRDVLRLENDLEKYTINTESYKITLKALNTARDHLRVDEQRNANLREWRDTFKSITGISNDWENSWWGKLANDPQAFNQAFKETFNAMNILHSTSAKIVEGSIAMAAAQDQALVGFNVATGASAKYGEELIALEQGMYTLGVGLEEASATMGALVQNVYNLESVSKKSRVELEQTTALLEKMGVDASVTTQNWQFLTAAMGVSGEQATKMQQDMFLTAQSLGRPAKEMATAFEANRKVMAKFGKESTEVFKKLYVNATKASMSVEQLLSITEKFDTFEGAATSVGKLNAILGGPFLNSMDMVMSTDPTERMKKLSDAVNNAGLSFDDMSYYQRKALADSMGLADVSELALLMAGDFDTMTDSQEMSQEQYQELAAQTKDFNTVMDEMKQIGRMLVVDFLQPLVTVLKTVFEYLQMAAPVIKVLAVGIPVLSAALAINAIKWKVLAGAIRETNFAMKMGPGGFISLMVTLIAMSTQMNGFFRVLTAGLIMATAAWMALNVASGGWMYILGGLLSVLIMLIAWVFQNDVGASTFLEGLFKMGHAFMEIGIGMLFAAAGVWLLLPALAALLMMSLPLLAATLPGGAFWSLSTGLGWIADSMNKMDTTKLGALTGLFKALAEITGEAAENIRAMGTGIAAMGAGFTMMSMSPLGIALAPALLAGGTVTSIGGPPRVQAGSGARGAVGGVRTGGREKLLPLTVKVELDGNKLGSFVKDVVVKELNVNKG